MPYEDNVARGLQTATQVAGKTGNYKIVHEHRDIFGHVSVLVNVPLTGTVPTTAFTASSTAPLTFEITAQPSYELLDHMGIWLKIDVSNTHGANAVTPCFAEHLLDRNSAVEYLLDGATFAGPYPAAAMILEPAMSLSDVEWQSLSATANHSSALAVGSSTSLVAAATASYYIRLVNPFPKGKGFWLGALASHRLQIRIKTTAGVSAGTGTLACTGLNLILQCVNVPSSEWGQKQSQWDSFVWSSEEVVVNESELITFAASGPLSQPIRLTNLNNAEVSRMVSFVHAAKDNVANAFWNLATLADNCEIIVKDKNGGVLFTTSTSYFQMLRYITGCRHLGDSKFLMNVPAVVQVLAPSFQDILHSGEDEGRYIFTGGTFFECCLNAITNTVGSFLQMNTSIWQTLA
jgi:hypothetical protein